MPNEKYINITIVIKYKLETAERWGVMKYFTAMSGKKLKNTAQICHTIKTLVVRSVSVERSIDAGTGRSRAP